MLTTSLPELRDLRISEVRCSYYEDDSSFFASLLREVRRARFVLVAGRSYNGNCLLRTGQLSFQVAFLTAASPCRQSRSRISQPSFLIQFLSTAEMLQ